MEPLRIHSVTWNVNARDIPEDTDLSQILGPRENYKNHNVDIYAVGFQEVSARVDKFLFDNIVSGDDCWSLAVRNVLTAEDYVKIRSIRLLGIVLNVYCLRKHLAFLRKIETQYTRLSLGGYLGFKGAVSVRFEVYGVSYCFVDSHLSAHDNMLETRINEYNNVIDTHKFKNRDTNNILYHDYVVWMGDLNFRLAEGTVEHDEIVQAVRDANLTKLLAVDQLTEVRDSQQAFHQLTDTKPEFPPTYKFVIGTQEYDTKRRPAWTDRILYRVSVHNYEDLGDDVELNLKVEGYTSYPDYTCSDHKPVSMTMLTSRFGEKLALEKDLPAFSPVVHFLESDLDQPWYVAEDGNVSYTVDPNGGQFLDAWDWIGLYHENFTSLDDYVTFCWASPCRRTGVPKHCVISDSALYAPGAFVLVYTTVNHSILAISSPFHVIHRPLGLSGQDSSQSEGEDEVELAEEATDALID